MNKTKFTKLNQNVKEQIGAVMSIHDIKLKELNGQQLSSEEWQALRNFDRYRIEELNKQQTDMEFHERYRQLQVIANLGDYTEFLKEHYFNI